MLLRQHLRHLLTRTILKPGKVRSIWRGPLRGCRYLADDLSGWSHLYGGWEPYAQAVYQRHVRPGYTVYDLGANTGMHALLFSKLVGAGGRVLAFEPLPLNIDRIQSVIRLNGLNNVTIVPKAVSDRTGTAAFDEGPNNFQGSLTANSGSSRKRIVETISLDDLIDQGAPAPDFIKMDIEGGEGDALKGFERHAEHCRPILAVDLHTPEQDLLVGDHLRRHNYSVYRIRSSTSKSKDLLTEIRYLDQPWPDASGIWGTVLALPR